MNGNIQLTTNKIHCNVLGCDELLKFRWYYINEIDNIVQQIENDSNIIDFIGNGQYIAKVKCGEIEAKFSNIFSNTIIEPVQQQQTNTYTLTKEWDFNKIPKKLTSKIKKMVKEEKIKDLILIHHEYQVSLNGYCCGDLSIVLTKFKEYLEWRKKN